MSVKRKLTLFFLGVVVIVEKRWDKKKQGNLKGITEPFKTKKITWLLTAAMYDASLSILIDKIEASDSGIYNKEKDMCNSNKNRRN